MNNQRRKTIKKAIELINTAKELLEDVRDDEQESFDNLPLGLQESERGERIQENIDNLESYIGYLEDVTILEEM